LEVDVPEQAPAAVPACAKLHQRGTAGGGSGGGVEGFDA
jgi:hypothetical protein